jgi:CRP-like cAMP-binding protein
MHPIMLKQLSHNGKYECIEKGITIFRHGDPNPWWYICLAGELNVVSVNSDAEKLCSLGPGSAFSEAVTSSIPPNSAIVSASSCELLRVEKKMFKMIMRVKF